MPIVKGALANECFDFQVGSSEPAAGACKILVESISRVFRYSMPTINPLYNMQKRMSI